MLKGMLCNSLEEALSFVPTGKVYRHYKKGGIYLVLNDNVCGTEGIYDRKRMIYYVCLFSDNPDEKGPYYVRSYEYFHGEVIVAGLKIKSNYSGPRFQKIDPKEVS